MAWARPAFFVLVLANVLMLAANQGYLGGTEAGREPQRLRDQLQPERIKATALSDPPQAKPATACRRIDGVAAADVERTRYRLEEAGLVATATGGEGAAASYWVHIPGLGDKTVAEKKSAELRALGINDFHVMPGEGGDIFAISLGVARTEGEANALLATLSKKGVRSARVEQRPGGPERVAIEVRGAADALNKHIAQLQADNPTLESKPCP